MWYPVHSMEIDLTNKTYEEVAGLRQQMHTRAFLIMFEVLGFIAFPAAGAAFLGRYLENSVGTGAWLTYTLLAVGFVISWVLILTRLKVFNTKLKAVETEYYQRKKK